MAAPRGGCSQEETYNDRPVISFSISGIDKDDLTTPLTSPSRSPSPLPSSPLQRTLLDKPLEELTDEDIMHLTREDCRRYLKQKGMRRPSWNKWQAIQQVLFLKGLFDSNGDEEKRFRLLSGSRKSTAEPAFTPNAQERSRAAVHNTETETFVKAASQACTNSSEPSRGQERKDKYELSNETCGSPWRSPEPMDYISMGNLSCGSSACVCNGPFTPTALGLKENFPSQRQTSSEVVQASGSSEMEECSQLTIFYSGIVNVYDNVPENKARDVMLLAEKSNKSSASLWTDGSNIDFGRLDLMEGGNASSRSVPQYVASSIATTNFSSVQAWPSSPATQSSKLTPSDYQPSRKACLQRYLKKRQGRNVRSPYTHSMKRVDRNCFPGNLIAKTHKLRSFLEVLGPSLTLGSHHHNLSSVQPPTQFTSETLSSCHSRLHPSS